MIIDAHQHFWRIGEHDCTWPTSELTLIHRNFEPRDLEMLAPVLGVIGSVLVQTQQSECDTAWLLNLAAEHDFIRAVVGWTDISASDASARIAALAQHPKIRGLRPMLQALPDDNWIANSALAPAVEAMIAHDLSLDALVYTRHLPALRVFAERHPQLRIVIDHGAKPPIPAGEQEPWRTEISALARVPNVFCKLSGLLTEASPTQHHEALAPYVSHLVTAFGPSRLMWGSDWPVLLLRGGYAEWLDLARRLGGFTSAEQDQVFAGTAREFYRL